MMVKKKFDVLLKQEQISEATAILKQAAQHQVTQIINIGTSVPESLNCVALAKAFDNCYATVGLHPNDCTAQWQHDLKKIEELLKKKTENKIVAVGECGMDFHYPDYNKQRQRDAFKAQIELALTYDLPLVIHSRDATDEILRGLEEFKNEARGIIHCFSAKLNIANKVISWGFVIGINGIITYPKNNYLRDVIKTVDLKHILLETDAPFLPPQIIRGKQNHPQHIETIAHYIAELKEISFENVAKQTTQNAHSLFNIG